MTHTILVKRGSHGTTLNKISCSNIRRYIISGPERGDFIYPRRVNAEKMFERMEEVLKRGRRRAPHFKQREPGKWIKTGSFETSGRCRIIQ